ncbi:glycosyltransferase family 2 protein [Thiorhodococcus mannitoliphagus]|uniref:Glycosyltransferase family 2 protein n=1 Tax=Thiorhodococcus mannitoliphagus TaxID=329406 RepID=A0A6P1DNV5_9GAMM|nr:glycosyltransferase family 2 protein [Thiorhodococcus mannitoliphagus]NEX19688.1 glycosyltransferase family 2 protein [Thiorhodococcus mannitoliphagus]
MNQTDPLVAIVTRTKNRTLLLDRCVKTVLAQTIPNWIHVIVNDGGDPKDIETLVEPYRDEYAGRLKVIHNEQSLGMEAASNVGIRASQSRYLVVLDDDDSWDPTFLDVMVEVLENETWPNTRGVFCHTEIIFEEIRGKEIRELGRKDFNGWLNAIDMLRLLASNRFTPVCFLFERSVVDEIGMFDESLPVIGDWEFNIRFLERFDITVHPEYLAFWHQRPKVKNGLGNSVIADGDLHDIYRSRMVNKWVRQSLQNGTLDYGQLFALSTILEQNDIMESRFHRYRKRIEKTLIYRIYSALMTLVRGKSYHVDDK